MVSEESSLYKYMLYVVSYKVQLILENHIAELKMVERQEIKMNFINWYKTNEWWRLLITKS